MHGASYPDLPTFTAAGAGPPLVCVSGCPLSLVPSPLEVGLLLAVLCVMLVLVAVELVQYRLG